MLSDTSPEAEAVRQQILSRMSISEKFALTESLTSMVVRLCKQGIRERHPEYDEQDVSIHYVEMNYGKELAEGYRRRLKGEK